MNDEEKNKKKKNKNITKKKLLNEKSDNIEDIDKEVEEFKKIIKNQTKHANVMKKVKPVITHDWIEFISKY